jgi:ATP-dependent helicase/nuclease subunit A
LEDKLPEWATNPAPQEARPPRPLAPSRIEPIDTEASPPPDPARRRAAERGIILHSLFERLPDVAPELRFRLGAQWLERSAGVSDQATRAELLHTVISVLDEPQFAALFAPGSLAEIPLAAVVEGRVIAGTVDRIIVTQDRVMVVDYKTGRRVPHAAEHVSHHHVAQMAAYVSALRTIYPGKAISAALLYTQGPKLITLSDADLDRHKPGFTAEQP